MMNNPVSKLLKRWRSWWLVCNLTSWFLMLCGGRRVERWCLLVRVSVLILLLLCLLYLDWMQSKRRSMNTWINGLASFILSSGFWKLSLIFILSNCTLRRSCTCLDYILGGVNYVTSLHQNCVKGILFIKFH